MLGRAPKLNLLDEEFLKGNSGFASGYPICPDCMALARPSILMFGDSNWVEDTIEYDVYNAWSSTTKKLLEHIPTFKLVILEIGCGDKVPTIRGMTEAAYLGLQPAETNNITLIRINKDFPFADSENYSNSVIPILGGASDTLHVIDKYVKELLHAEIAKKGEKDVTENKEEYKEEKQEEYKEEKIEEMQEEKKEEE